MNTYEATEQAYKNGYEQGKKDAVKRGRCFWCEPGEEACGTCVRFYSIDGTEDRCSAEFNAPKCAYYEPINYCPNCGAKMDLEG